MAASSMPLIVLVTACGRFGFDEVDADSALDAGSDPPTLVFGQPQLIAGVSSGAFETHPCVRFDGLELMYSSGGDIWSATRATEADPWGSPIRIAELNDALDDHMPVLSRDGLTVYVNRLGGSPPARTLVAQRPTLGSPWTAPILVAELGMVGLGALLEGDLAMVVAEGDIMFVRRPSRQDPWGAPVALAAAGVLRGSDGWMDDSLRALVFQTFRDTSSDVYGAIRSDASQPFTTAVPLAISTPGQENAPWLSPDGQTIYFSRDGDLYIATAP